jgi:putative transposase
MPRTARKKSPTGIYHVVLRGNNKQAIFEDVADYRKMLAILKNYRGKCGYEIYAYCLMNNHIHLLIKEGEEDLGLSFRRIGVAYVLWYNRKYGRCGHLFQDRYRSKVVDSDRYFMTVLRYIHQNPWKAGIAGSVAAYPWSSYGEYIGGPGPKICNIEFALSMFSKNEIETGELNEKKNEALKLFIEFNSIENTDQCLDYDEGKENIRLADSEAAEIIKNVAGLSNPLHIQSLEKRERTEVIRKLKARGLSIRQIERLTGVSFAVIRRA